MGFPELRIKCAARRGVFQCLPSKGGSLQKPNSRSGLHEARGTNGSLSPKHADSEETAHREVANCRLDRSECCRARSGPRVANR